MGRADWFKVTDRMSAKRSASTLAKADQSVWRVSITGCRSEVVVFGGDPIGDPQGFESLARFSFRHMLRSRQRTISSAQSALDTDIAAVEVVYGPGVAADEAGETPALPVGAGNA